MNSAWTVVPMGPSCGQLDGNFKASKGWMLPSAANHRLDYQDRCRSSPEGSNYSPSSPINERALVPQWGSLPGTKPSAFVAQSRGNNNFPNNNYACNFCRRNGDPRDFFSGHRLKDEFGKVECPILRKYVCDVCGATGDEAHTLSYCPVLRAVGRKPQRNAGSLKDTPRDSCGRIRRGWNNKVHF